MAIRPYFLPLISYLTNETIFFRYFGCVCVPYHRANTATYLRKYQQKLVQFSLQCDRRLCLRGNHYSCIFYLQKNKLHRALFFGAFCNCYSCNSWNTHHRLGEYQCKFSRSSKQLSKQIRNYEIGRASCRERVQISVVAVSLKKKA